MYQLKVNQQQTIVSLSQRGWSKRRIARELDLDRATVRKYLARANSKSPTPQTGSAESSQPKSPTNPQTGSSLGCGPASLCEPWRELIEQALEQGLSIQRIYQDLVVERQFAGSYLRCAVLCCIGSVSTNCRSGGWRMRKLANWDFIGRSVCMVPSINLILVPQAFTRSNHGII